MAFKVGVVIVCAGIGKRLGGADKAVLDLGGNPLFYHSYRVFRDIKQISQIVLVLRKKNFPLAKKLITDKKVLLVAGGRERNHSVYNGLCSLSEDIDYVLVHDGARPFVGVSVVGRILKELKKSNAVICALPCRDTVKTVQGNYVKNTLVREELVCVQTPQGFKRDLLLKAYNELGQKKVLDDAQAVEFMGEKVKVVSGDFGNIKITYPEDMRYAQTLMGDWGYRVGLGFDVHRFSSKKKRLILCAVSVSSDFGVDAVSDGDVPLHAISDGICGACELGDIGDYFPPSDRKSKGIRSTKIVKTILGKIKNRYKIENIDVTIIAEKPRLSGYKKLMTESLRKIFPAIAVNIKIKSKEGLDILGGQEAIACLANVLVKKIGVLE